jgi:Tfp pilus assembly protein PilO
MAKQNGFIFNLLKGSFLTEENSQKNWLFIIFLAALAIIMISSSLSIENKVQEISRLDSRNKEMRSLFVSNRAELMNLKMESSITKALNLKGIKPPTTPPYKIKVIVTN